ncbi:MAG: hypothetical protein J6N21_09440, partial [Butyrivibrio sp.]|nr:hypothetical protein [Butyrivibrio sp.]
KRLEHTRAVIEALQANPEAKNSELYIFSDAPANDKDEKEVENVRKYIHSLNGFRNIVIVERESNYGIEKTELDGVTSVLEKYGKAIVLEDDIQVCNQFLRYMNYCLNEYQNDKNVFTITGYSFFKTVPENDNIFGFTRSFSAWGWGTWADRWDKLKRNLTKKDVRFVAKHNISIDNGQDFSYLFMHQYKNDSITWDVAWYYSCFYHNGLTIFPYNSMVNNIGMDGSGIHYNDNSKENRLEPINVRSEFNAPLKLDDWNVTLRKVIKEKKNANRKSLFKKIKMAARLWVNTIEILFFGKKIAGIKL